MINWRVISWNDATGAGSWGRPYETHVYAEGASETIEGCRLAAILCDAIRVENCGYVSPQTGERMVIDYGQWQQRTFPS